MPHTTRKELARRRTAYTGESYQEACEALRACRTPLPEAADAHQRLLESRIMVALASASGTAPRTWMPPLYFRDYAPSLGIEKVRPTATGLELVVHSHGFTRCLADVGFIEGDLPAGDRYELVDERTTPGARVVVRVRSPLTARAHPPYPRPRLRPVDPVMARWIEARGVGWLAMNPRWSRDTGEVDRPESAVVASQLLRRSALFANDEAFRWVTAWKSCHAQAPLTYAEWLPDAVPFALAERLADPDFGITVPKEPENASWEMSHGDRRYLAGPELDRILAGAELSFPRR
ncbi:hypothetical protein OG292_04315 [Streptomyces sp. NBC_01511]|uniref:hypothetical protein n=1 Tax=unclassified Streptomyces TaxID=2593676 RepID=UPI00386DF291